MTYAAAECANAVEEFRYRFLDGRIVLFDRIHTSFTYLHEDTGLFKVVRVDMQDSMAAYVALAAETVKKQTAYFAGPPEPDVFQFSAIPWISFTHISHTDSGRPDNAVPLIDWGKYRERDGRMPLPFSVQVHHSFVDALHVGQFVNRLQQYLDTWQPADE